jgi:hypothetical protein
MIDLGPPPLVFPKPAIIRPSTRDLLNYGLPVGAVLPGIAGAMQGYVAAPLVFSLTNTANGVTNGATLSFGAAPGAGETRYIVIVGRTFGGEITAIAIGGSAGTDVITAGAAGNRGAAVYIREVASGTTGVVTITAGAATAFAISVFRMMNPSSAAAHAIASDVTPSSGLLGLSLNVAAGGGWVAGSQQVNGGANDWTPALSEVHDVDINSDEWSSAAFGVQSGTPLTVTDQSADTAPTGMVGASASWAPA